jgi:hypothetical protein
MDVTVDCEALNAFYKAEEGGGWCSGGEMTGDEWSSLMRPFWGEEKKRQCPFRKVKGAYRVALGSRTKG